MSDEYGPGPTEALTPKQMRERADALTKQARQLREESIQYEIGASPFQPSKKDVSATKSIINISYVLFGLVGIVGSFWDKFDMSKYVTFLETFAYIWAPLVVAVGGGRAFKNFVKKKYGHEEL